MTEAAPQPSVAEAPLPEILVISLGGTIASVPAAGGGDAVPSLTPEQLVASVPGLHEVASLECEAFRQFPSGDLSVVDIVELSRLIERRAADVDGIVVTQGTDTLEETSFLLHLLLRTTTPVAMTGAMRNSGLPGADGPANLLAAVRVAAAADSAGQGVLVVFADEVHSARFVRKTHSSSPSTFQSPTVGPVGYVVEGRVRLPFSARRVSAPLPPAGVDDLPTVPLVRMVLGDDGSLVRLAANGADGLVVEAFGGGHVPARIVPLLESVARDIPVVVTTRTGAGDLYTNTYGFPGSESDLWKRGLIPAGPLDGLKARLALMVLLMGGADRAAVAAFFDNDY